MRVFSSAGSRRASRKLLVVLVLGALFVCAASGFLGARAVRTFLQEVSLQQRTGPTGPEEEVVVSTKGPAEHTIRLSWEATSGLLQALAGIVGVVLSVSSLLLAVLVYYWDKRNEKRLQCREIYQRLELASVDLFRFECEHPEVVATLWTTLLDASGRKIPVEKRSVVELYTVRAYVCQMLNLFEMALRFRKDGTMEPEVFGSWVIWMSELCANETFQDLWDDLRLNYVGLLRHIFSHGIAIFRSDNPQQLAAFFKMVAGHFDQCPHITEFLAEPAGAGPG